jgi:phosphotriesterase-related protein
MDRFGLNFCLSFSDRVDTVARMCERGHADKMVLSHDASCYIDWLPEEALPLVVPNWHYLHIHTTCCPRCGAQGDRGTDHHHARRQPRAIFTAGSAR